jgi:hypothetical protein
MDRNDRVVGAPGTSTDAGQAFIYVNGSSGWPTTPAVTLSDPAATAQDIFGFSVAVSRTTVVVGAPVNPATGQGTVYLYVNGGKGWRSTPTATLSDPAATEGDHFGYSVSASYPSVVVGDPWANSKVGTAYIYVRGTSGWQTSPTTTLRVPAGAGFFGATVSVSEGVAAVGAPYTNSDTGAAYLYVEGASAWSKTPKTTISDPAASSGDYFAFSVAVAGKASVVGAIGPSPYDGTAYIFKA